MFLYILISIFSLTTSDYVINNAVRNIDLKGQVVRKINELSVECQNSNCDEFIYTIKKGEDTHLAYISAKIKGADGKKTLLPLVSEHKNLQGEGSVAIYKLDIKKIPDSIQYRKPGSTFTIQFTESLIHILQPYPDKIKQAEKQLLLYKDNALLWSPYTIKKQTTLIKFPSTRIEPYTMIKDATKLVDKQKLQYGSFENISPYSSHDIAVHYEFNAPLLTVTNLKRVIEVSHWGNIAFEEKIDIENFAAKLTGPFSRFEFQQPSGESPVAVVSYQTILPASAHGIYYRDEIGNISTSNVLDHGNAKEVLIKPRFPLFGGWKTKYTLGYNVPIYEYLSNSGSKYELKVRFIDHIYHDEVIDKANVQVILPEGSKNIEVEVPFNYERVKDSKHFTYLDTVGRPVIELHKENLVDEHIQEFIVRYNFNKMDMFQEPLLLVGAYFLLFLIVIVYVRLDFSITKDEASETKMRAASHIEQIRYLQEERISLYDSYVECLTKFKGSKDVSLFNADRKKIESDLKRIGHKMTDIQALLKIDSPDAADKVSELQKLDRNLKEQMVVWVSNAEKVVGNKMSRPVYLDTEKVCVAKKEEIVEKMETILNSL